MTLQELDELFEDTRRTSRAGDKVAHAMALGVLEIARQLTIMNQAAAKKNGNGSSNGKAKAAKRK